MIKVVVIDDSVFMRNSLTRMLTSDPEIEVVGHAGDGIEGLEKIKELNPDIITLDIEMPRMDGLQMLEKLMSTNPKPVLMISSLSFEGAEATLKALDLGALDYMPKYVEGTTVFAVAQKELTEKIKSLSKKNATVRFLAARLKSRPKTFTNSPSVSSSTSLTSKVVKPMGSTIGATHSSVLNQVKKQELTMPSGKPKRDIVAIGVSTGGPPAVQQVLSALPENFPACILIAQHMPAAFTGAFAKRLDSLCKIKVKEAETGDMLVPGVAYVCPGGQHISLDVHGAMPHIKISPEPSTELYKPSASILNKSVSIMANKVVGLTMTGMGSDGCEGTKVLKSKGGYILAQSEETCVVYGMPRAVVEAKLAHEIVDLDDIAESLIKALYK